MQKDLSAYNFVASSANDGTNKARTKMEEIINGGIPSAVAVIEQVQNRIVMDSVVKGSALRFAVAPRPVQLDTASAPAPAPEDAPRIIRPSDIEIILPDSNRRRFHANALTQAAERADVPMRYINGLFQKGEWGADLVAHSLNEIFGKGNGTRYLLRQVGAEARGFLSDRYRRIDSRPLLESFVAACQALGAQPIEGFALETKVRLRAVIPVLFEPIPGEFMIFGIEWGNSDFGDGGHTVKLWSMRVACKNGATLDQVLKQVHLGARLQESVEYSNETYRLDTQANASALRDVVLHALNPTRVNGYLLGIKTAAEEKLDPKRAAALLKKQLSKEETEKTVEAFTSLDIENLPAGQSTYRLAQAISWIANAPAVTPERKLELQQFAGDMMPKPDVKPVEV
jgi:hypothetical protein